MSGLAPIGGKKKPSKRIAGNDDEFDALYDAPTSGSPRAEDSFDSSFNSTSLASETSFPSPSPTKTKIRNPNSTAKSGGGGNKSFLNDSVDLESSSGDLLEESNASSPGYIPNIGARSSRSNNNPSPSVAKGKGANNRAVTTEVDTSDDTVDTTNKGGSSSNKPSSLNQVDDEFDVVEDLDMSGDGAFIPVSRGLCLRFKKRVYFSILLASYVMWSGALQSTDLLLSHPTISLTPYITIILIIPLFLNPSCATVKQIIWQHKYKTKKTTWLYRHQ